MNKKVTVEVLVPNLKVNKYFNEELEIIRREEKITVIQKLLQPGDRFETDIEYAEYLEKSKAVKIVNNKKNIPTDSLDNLDD